LSNDFYTSSILPYAGIIIKVCRLYTHSQEDFEDYYQEVCLQIWRSKDNFKGNAQWSTWIYRLSLNVCLTLLKKKQKKQQHLDANEHLISTTEFETDPLDELDQLYIAIRKLSEIDRALILLYLEEKSYREIAEILGTNPNNVGVRIKRIKEKLIIIINGKIN